MNVRQFALYPTLAAAIFSSAANAQIPGASQPWPVKTREYVDLWLHGFAMVSADSSVVPLFSRGYRELLAKEKNTAGVFTDLDANRDSLAKRLQENPALVNAQFVVFGFSSWTELDGALDAFLQAGGDPKKAPNQRAAQQVAVLAAAFPLNADRDFARRMALSLRSEDTKFFHQWWTAEMERRAATLAAVDSLWQRIYQPQLKNYLNHTQQANGEIILSLALEGEGRTVAEGRNKNTIAIGFPGSPDHAMDAIYALAHEIIGPLVSASVEDNVTPAEKRSGFAARLSAIALVRGGALLLQRINPALVTGYQQFYLRAAGAAGGGDTASAFDKAFPAPQGLLDSINRQIAVAFGGI